MQAVSLSKSGNANARRWRKQSASARRSRQHIALWKSSLMERRLGECLKAEVRDHPLPSAMERGCPWAGANSPVPLLAKPRRPPRYQCQRRSIPRPYQREGRSGWCSRTPPPTGKTPPGPHQEEAQRAGRHRLSHHHAAMDRQEMSFLEMGCCDPDFRRSGPKYFARAPSVGERTGGGSRAAAAIRASSQRTADGGTDTVPRVHSRTKSSRQRSWFASTAASQPRTIM